MYRWQSLPLVLLALAGLVAGCNDLPSHFNSGNGVLAAPLSTLSVYQLAGRLKMTVASSSRVLATLRDSANVVMVYGDPQGSVYVNGEPLSNTGGITPAGETLFVPEGLVGRIRALLRIGAEVGIGGRLARGRSRERAAGPVLLDAGHGGRDPGTISITDIYEKAVALAATLATADHLASSGIDVLLTRRDDTFVPLNERADTANRLDAELLVSIHADSSQNRSAYGTTVYVARSASRDSLALARAVDRRLGASGAACRGVRRANFRVLVRTTCPAVLVELGYLSNIAEAAKLSQSHYRRRLAGAIAEGILEYLEQR